MRHDDLYYWEGEKPPPLTVRYEDKNNVLITTIPTAALRAQTKIDAAAEKNINMTNNGDGSMTIDWNTTTSDFVLAGTRDGIMRIDIEVTQGATVWHLPRFSVPVKKRT